MRRIGGNVTAYLQYKTVSSNEIGESVTEYATLKTLKGFLDLSSGAAGYQTYNAKIEESTHSFICDYVVINLEESECRLLVNGKAYDVLYIDNPMNLNKHLEIYLKYTGA